MTGSGERDARLEVGVIRLPVLRTGDLGLTAARCGAGCCTSSRVGGVGWVGLGSRGNWEVGDERFRRTEGMDLQWVNLNGKDSKWSLSGNHFSSSQCNR